MEWSGLGKSLIVLGLGVAVLGFVVLLVGRWPGVTGGFGWLGRLPGDILVKRDHVVFYFPLATSILISVILTLVITLVSLFFRR